MEICWNVSQEQMHLAYLLCLPQEKTQETRVWSQIAAEFEKNENVCCYYCLAAAAAVSSVPVCVCERVCLCDCDFEWLLQLIVVVVVVCLCRRFCCLAL